jgi:SAM-dependent methyltransferase
MAEPWNVNIHYDGRLDDCVPPRAASVLEVGCGDGFLAARLSKRLPNVVAVDIDEPVLEPAKQRFPTAPVKWLCGDILAMADELWDFDAVVTFAARAGATCHGHWPRSRFAGSRSGYAANGNSAPTVWPPRYTVAELPRHVRGELPGARVSLLTLGRVFIQWDAAR